MASLSDSCLDPTSQQIDYCHLQIRKLRVMEAKNPPHSHPGGRWQNLKAKGGPSDGSEVLTEEPCLVTSTHIRWLTAL